MVSILVLGFAEPAIALKAINLIHHVMTLASVIIFKEACLGPGVTNCTSLSNNKRY